MTQISTDPKFALAIRHAYFHWFTFLIRSYKSRESAMPIPQQSSPQPELEQAFRLFNLMLLPTSSSNMVSILHGILLQRAVLTNVCLGAFQGISGCYIWRKILIRYLSLAPPTRSTIRQIASSHLQQRWLLPHAPME